MNLKNIIQKHADEKFKGTYRFFKEKNLKALIGENGYNHIKSLIDPKLSESISLMVYCYMNDIYQYPICVCGNKQKFNTTKKEFSKYCSNKCRFENFSDVVEVRKQTNLKKYGSTNVLTSDFGKNKIKNTLIEKYGVDNYTKTEEYKKRAVGRTASESTKELMSYKVKRKHYDSLLVKYPHCVPLFLFEEYEGVKGYKKYKWLCKECNNKFESSCDNGSSPVCNYCKPKETDLELHIRNILDKFKTNYTYGNRDILPSGKELDFYLPEHKIGIEVHGLYWHSTAGPSYKKQDHISKHEECVENGIKLISIYADEIYNKSKIIENRLKHILKNNKKIIHARKCVVKNIDFPTCDKFVKKYHIQGNIPTGINYGLFYKNRLIAVMSFTKGRSPTGNKSKVGEYELGRYVTIANFKVVGGAGKLLSHFKTDYTPDIIYTYADRRWSDGNLYKKIGFKLIDITKPNYWYVKDFYNRLHRYKFRKSELKHFPNYSNSKTENEIMSEMKYYKTWDCGNYKFVWCKNEETGGSSAPPVSD